MTVHIFKLIINQYNTKTREKVFDDVAQYMLEQKIYVSSGIGGDKKMRTLAIDNFKKYVHINPEKIKNIYTQLFNENMKI
jgi:hypothetical protein